MNMKKYETPNMMYLATGAQDVIATSRLKDDGDGAGGTVAYTRLKDLTIPE